MQIAIEMHLHHCHGRYGACRHGVASGLSTCVPPQPLPLKRSELGTTLNWCL